VPTVFVCPSLQVRSQVAPFVHANEHAPVQVTWHAALPLQLMALLVPIVTVQLAPPLQLSALLSPMVRLQAAPELQFVEQELPQMPAQVLWLVHESEHALLSHIVPASVHGVPEVHEHELPLHAAGMTAGPQASSDSARKRPCGR
jgi:hypothetical protein